MSTRRLAWQLSRPGGSEADHDIQLAQSRAYAHGNLNLKPPCDQCEYQSPQKAFNCAQKNSLTMGPLLHPDEVLK